ncbi:hypothetical protein HWV62_44063, partial [Athelia sp. TMB]
VFNTYNTTGESVYNARAHSDRDNVGRAFGDHQSFPINPTTVASPDHEDILEPPRGAAYSALPSSTTQSTSQRVPPPNTSHAAIQHPLIEARLMIEMICELYRSSSHPSEANLLGTLTNLQRAITLAEMVVHAYAHTSLLESLNRGIAATVDRCHQLLRDLLSNLKSNGYALETAALHFVQKSTGNISSATALNLGLRECHQYLATCLVSMSRQVSNNTMILVSTNISISANWPELEQGSEISSRLTEMCYFLEIESQSVEPIRAETLTVIDHLGRIISVPLIFCKIWQRGDYMIVDSADDTVINGADISTKLRSDMTVEICIVIHERAQDNGATERNQCPRTLINVPSSQECFDLFQIMTEEQNAAFSDLFDALHLSEPWEEDQKLEDIRRFRRIFVRQHVTLEEDSDATATEPVQDSTDVQDLKGGKPRNDDLDIKHESLPARDHSNGSEGLGKYEGISHRSAGASWVGSVVPVALEVTSERWNKAVAVTERLQDDAGNLGSPSVETNEDRHDQEVKHLEWGLFAEDEEQNRLETSPIHSTPAAKTSRTSGTRTHTAVVTVSATSGNVYNINGDYSETHNELHAPLDLLKILTPITMDATDRPHCLPGTREAILQTFFHDLTTIALDSPKIFCLTGAPGSGKSTVATTIAENLLGKGQLGAFLFFERSNPENVTGGVIRTWAHQLAMFDQTLRAAICAAIERDAAIATRPLSNQFQELLLKPMSIYAENNTNLVITILDAFDECGSDHSRRPLFRLLSQHLHDLPITFRVLIVGRPGSELHSAFCSHSVVKSVSLDCPQWRSAADVLHYIKYELHELCQARGGKLGLDWPGQPRIDQLGNCAGTSFEWASATIQLLWDASGDVDGCLDRLLGQPLLPPVTAACGHEH